MDNLKILYTCNTVEQALGIDADVFDPAFQFSITHPDDVQRHGIARSTLIKLCSELSNSDNKHNLLSSNLRYQHTNGQYTNFLIQCYAFKSLLPKPSVYCLFVNTDIDWYGPIKHGYHYYVGEDLSYFRKPDTDLILTGCVFTERELEILKLIRQGHDSSTIGKQLFISSHTVDTHRRNILKKTNKSNTSELIIDLQESGYF